MTLLFAILGVAAGLGLLVWAIIKLRPDLSQWHGAHVYRHVRAIDGQWYPPQLMMRRKVNGSWEYRVMTAEELREYQMEAW